MYQKCVLIVFWNILQKINTPILAGLVLNRLRPSSLLLLQLLTSCTPQIGTFEYQTWLKCFRNWDMIFNYRLFMALEMEFLICSNVHLSLFLAMTFSNFAISNPIQFQYQNWFENDFFLLLNVIWRKTILSDEIL